MKRLNQIVNDYTAAYNSLKEAIEIASSDLEIDGVIQRFEFTFELFWKMLKRYLENEGINVNSPKKVLMECYAIGIFDEEQILLKMLEDRNETTHLYDKKISREIFKRIKRDYIIIFQNILDLIKKEV